MDMLAEAACDIKSILIIDDQRLIRDILALGLENNLDGARVDTAKDLESGLEYLDRRPETDVILLNYKLSDCYGTACVRRLRGRMPDARIIVISEYIDQLKLKEIERSGADGAITKNVGIGELCAAIRKVFEGGKIFEASDPRINTAQIAERYRLSRREMEAWTYLANGLRNGPIAEIMGISESTVKVHLHNLFKKIGVRSRVEAYEFWNAVRQEVGGG